MKDYVVRSTIFDINKTKTNKTSSISLGDNKKNTPINKTVSNINNNQNNYKGITIEFILFFTKMKICLR